MKLKVTDSKILKMASLLPSRIFVSLKIICQVITNGHLLICELII